MKSEFVRKRVLLIVILGLCLFALDQGVQGTTPQPSIVPTLASSPVDPTLISNYPIPTPNSTPDAIIAGADNHTFWFTEIGAGKIGEFSTLTSNVTKEFAINETGAMPATLALDGRGLVWFTDQNQNSPSVWFLNTTSGIFHRISTNSFPSDPIFVLVDSTTNDLWYTDYYGNYLGEIAGPNAVPVKFGLPVANSDPVEIAKQNGSSYLWITEATGRIARFDMVGHTFQDFTPTVSLSYPVGVVVDGNSNVWVSEHGGSSVAEFIQSNSTWRKFPTSQANASPGTGVATLAIDRQGRLWFAEHYSNRIGRLDPATGQMDEFDLPIPGAYSLLDTVDAGGNFWFTEATANKIGMILGNATAPVSLRPVTRPNTPLAAGSTTHAQFIITNTNQTSAITLSLNVTSSFTSYYYTTYSEVSLSSYSLKLGPGQSENITTTVTPDHSLSSGIYSAGIVATSGLISSVATFFFQVNADPLYEFVTILPEILIASTVVLLVVFLLIRRPRSRGIARQPTFAPKTTLLASLIVIFFALVQSTGLAWGKCPGLPRAPGSNGPDFYGIALDVGSITFFAIVAYLLIRNRLREMSKSGEQEPSSP